ncbi:MAG: pheS [Bacillales bacterium]|jgi:phenylalanyl-tRNA synthetase alpha chain|nr:pheS [Bacillales bacterium]
MKEKLEALKTEAVVQITAAESLKDLNDVRVAYLGKKGPITELMQGMKSLPAEERPQFGAIVNVVKNEIAQLIEEKQGVLEEKEVNEKLAKEQIDITLPGAPIKIGSRHPLTKTSEDIEDLFISLGYSVAEGPEVESDHYNFEMLNLPKGHPARDMQDSFYINEDTLLRTHTSPVQIRTLLKHAGQGPVKIICPGKVFRRDDDDATHSHQFMQVEGLVVDENVTMADLKGTLEVFVKKTFGESREIRLRPSFFPFTEPSVEVDLSCIFCGGKGCGTCKQTGWIEILGAGMVHPNVLEMAGFDSKKYTGFAFGMGVERIAMLKYGVTDIRGFYTNDVRFLSQFKRN